MHTGACHCLLTCSCANRQQQPATSHLRCFCVPQCAHSSLLVVMPPLCAAGTTGGVTPEGYPGALDATTNLNMAFEAVGALPTATTFTVMRWGGTNRVAQVTGSGATRKLVLPIDLSTSSKCGATQNSQCGDGKYLVKRVTAHRWVTGGSFTSDTAGTKTSTDRTQFTFVGEQMCAFCSWCIYGACNRSCCSMGLCTPDAAGSPTCVGTTVKAGIGKVMHDPA